MSTLRTLPFQTLGLPISLQTRAYHKETLHALPAEHMSADGGHGGDWCFVAHRTDVVLPILTNEIHFVQTLTRGVVAIVLIIPVDFKDAIHIGGLLLI